MRKTLIVVLLCLLARSAHSQEVSFYLYITDKDRITEYDEGIPIFDDQDINDIFDSYEVTHFTKAFPMSEYEYLQTVYLVKADSIGLAEELYNFDSVLFSYYALKEEVFPLAYYPDDWHVNQTNTNDTSHLDLINASEAWDIEKGNPNTIIGIADTYFDLTHEDMKGQYAKVRTNVLNSIDDAFHGSLVASLIAAKTNNDTGTAAIGFNCRLHVSSDYSIDELLEMVQDTSKFKARVVNASFGGVPTPNYYWNTQFGLSLDQGVCTEIYERGVLIVAGAGNGRVNQEKNNRNFIFPASYDHVFSVSGIGHEGDTSFNSFNGKFVHEFNAGDSTASHQHNARVDLCAPSVRISGHTYDPNNLSTKYQWRSGWGTSFSAPMVTGTVGLLLSKMPWLTPYQLEYILKKSSYNHYNISYNQKYAGTTRWNGRLGAGTLDARAALDSLAVDSFIADYPTTLTFRIKGMSLNTKCEPGKYAGVPNPELKVVMENGTPPYRYKWEQLQGNNAWIFPLRDSTGVTNITATIPSLINPIMGYRVHWRLTVYDNSEIEKVASYVLDFQLKSDSTYDLAMQDSWADQYDEPNKMLSRSPNNWDIWTSPDLWNRLAADLDTTHQDPDTMVTNHMHVRIKNVGCAPSPNDPDFVNVHLYWTLLATGEVWDRDWIGNGSIIGIPSPPAPPPGGRITPSTGIPIPPLAVGEDTILTQDWIPPNPHDFDTTGLLNRIEVCALARIQTNQFAPNYGITHTEIDTTKVNVLNNNNIVTRNFVSINVRTGPATNPPASGIVVINPRTGGGSNVTLQLITENQLMPYIAGHLASYMSITVHLGELYDVWDAGGNQGNPTSYNEGNKTVTWNMEEPLRLENIELEDGDKYFVILEFIPKSGVSLPHEVKDKLVHFRLVSPQAVEIDNGDGTTFEVTRDYVHSAVNYAISVTEDEESGSKPGRPTKTGTLKNEKENWFDVYPNPVNGKLTVSISDNTKSAYRLTVTDILGKVVFEDDKAMFNNSLYHINTSSFAPGVYHIQLTDKAGKTQVKKFVKVE